jgi:hypothetical protein
MSAGEPPSLVFVLFLKCGEFLSGTGSLAVDFSQGFFEGTHDAPRSSIGTFEQSIFNRIEFDTVKLRIIQQLPITPEFDG